VEKGTRVLFFYGKRISRHGRRKDFFQGVPVRNFLKNLSKGGPKVVKFGFYSSKLKKQPFFAKHFRIHGGQGPPFRRPCLQTETKSEDLSLISTGVPNWIVALKL